MTFKPKTPHKRTCPCCSSEFETFHSHKKYCSSPCQIKESKRVSWDNKKIHPSARCRQLISMAKNRSKDKSLDFNLDHGYLVDLWDKQCGRCDISGIVFNLDYPEKPGEPRFDAPSLDRIKPELGYIKGNVRLVIYQINMAIGPYGLDRLLETIKMIKGS